MIKTLVVIGGRPQIIKALPLLKNKLAKKYKIKLITVNTGQHYSKSLLGNFYSNFNIKPSDYNLKCSKNNHVKQITQIITGLDKIISKEKPDSAVIFGDMNSTLAAALACFERQIPIIHVESGTRSGNLNMKEENNRIITDHLSSILMAPDNDAISNLQKIVTNKQKIVNSGDIMLESLKLTQKSKTVKSVEIKPYLLLTLHRDENVSSQKQLNKIFKFVLSQNKRIVFPCHPKTAKAIKKYNILLPSHIKIIEPVDHQKILNLAENAEMVLTDSGGLQKEACWLGIPCIVLRDETETPSIVRNEQAFLYRNYRKGMAFKNKKTNYFKRTSNLVLDYILKLKANQDKP